jgi:hypothetical protein
MTQNPQKPATTRSKLRKLLRPIFREREFPAGWNFGDGLSALRPVGAYVAKTFPDWISEWDARWEIAWQINRAILPKQEKLPEPPYRLCDIFTDEESVEIMGAYVEQMSTLPYSIQLAITMGSIETVEVGEFELLDGVKIIGEARAEPAAQGDLIPTSGLHLAEKSLLGNALAGAAEAGEGPAASVVRVRGVGEGYFDNQYTDSGMQHALSKIRQSLGLAHAHGWLARGFGPSKAPSKATVCVGQSVVPITLLHHHSSYLATLELGGANRGASSVEEVSANFARIREQVAATDDELETKAFLAATEWAFEAAASADGTQGLLSTCFGIEALIGGHSKETKDLTIRALLKERAAMLLGTSWENRKSIRDQIGEMYDLRSDIVHGRKTRLHLNDDAVASSATLLLHQLIRREAEFLTE